MKCGNSGLSGLSGLIETSYAEKVLSYGPIAYWPLRETAGTVARCLVNPLQNGTYVGVTLGQAGIGDGNTCPLFDGINDLVNIYSITLNAAFNGAEGTAAIWAKVFNAGVWTDATNRVTLELQADINNYLDIMRNAVNNQLQARYTAGGVFDTVVNNPGPATDWMFLAHTWSASADQYRYYFNGVQTGLTQAGLGVWAGALNANNCCIGAWNTGAAFPWHGRLAHAQVYDYAVPPGAMVNLATA